MHKRSNEVLIVVVVDTETNYSVLMHGFIFICYKGSWCILKGSELTTFDKKKIPCNPKAPCTYILTEDRKENWRVELEMKTPKRRIIRFTTKRMTRQIEMFPDLTVRVNGKPATMPFTFDKAQMRVAADLRQWNLKTLYLRYIEVTWVVPILLQSLRSLVIDKWLDLTKQVSTKAAGNVLNYD